MGVAGGLPRAHPPAGAGKGRADPCARTSLSLERSPREHQGKGRGATPRSLGGDVFPGTEGTKQKANVYLMTFLCMRPLFCRARFEQSLA